MARKRAVRQDKVQIAKSRKAVSPHGAEASSPARRIPGQGKGRWQLARDFGAPLPKELLAGFEGR